MWAFNMCYKILLTGPLDVHVMNQFYTLLHTNYIIPADIYSRISNVLNDTCMFYIFFSDVL
jgi:hypothetical protein